MKSSGKDSIFISFINDYKSLIDTMPGNFGAPAKVSISEVDNKIAIKILSYDQTGVLTQTVSNNIKTNLATYLSKYDAQGMEK